MNQNRKFRKYGRDIRKLCAEIFRNGTAQSKKNKGGHRELELQQLVG